MTMSVMVSRKGEGGEGEGGVTAAKETFVFVKGSFEAVAARCKEAVSGDWVRDVDTHHFSKRQLIAKCLKQSACCQIDCLK